MIFDEAPNAKTKPPRKVSNRIGHAPPPARGKQAKRNTVTGAGINLRAVAEVLLTYDMDPTVEFAKVLATEGALDPETRARMCLEIMPYVHPKLKSVELTQDKPFEAIVRWATD